MGNFIAIIVRPILEYKYEILSGHNRWYAAQKVGLNYVPIIQMHGLSEEEAMLIVTETNLIQRSFADLSHSERAFILARHYAIPFGYIKDTKDKNQLIIDINTIETMILIFDLAKQGLGIARIRKILNEEMILRPGADAIKKGGNFTRYFEENEENKYTWSNNSVRSILRNPVYAGHLVGYKWPILSMKSNKRLTALPEDWEIVKNTHEPIISQNDFDLVQKMITSRRREMG